MFQESRGYLDQFKVLQYDVVLSITKASIKPVSTNICLGLKYEFSVEVWVHCIKSIYSSVAIDDMNDAGDFMEDVEDSGDESPYFRHEPSTSTGGYKVRRMEGRDIYLIYNL